MSHRSIHNNQLETGRSYRTAKAKNMDLPRKPVESKEKSDNKTVKMNFGQNSRNVARASSSVEQDNTAAVTIDSDENGHNQPINTKKHGTDPSSHCVPTQADDESSLWPHGCVARTQDEQENNEGQEVDDDGEVLHKRLCHLENETQIL